MLGDVVRTISRDTGAVRAARTPHQRSHKPYFSANRALRRESKRDPALSRGSEIVSMKEAGVVKGVWGVSPEVIAVLSGEAGWVKRRFAQGLAGAGVLALDAACRVWQWVRVRGRVGGGEQRSSLYRLHRV